MSAGRPERQPEVPREERPRWVHLASCCSSLGGRPDGAAGANMAWCAAVAPRGVSSSPSEKSAAGAARPSGVWPPVPPPSYCASLRSHRLGRGREQGWGMRKQLGDAAASASRAQAPVECAAPGREVVQLLLQLFVLALDRLQLRLTGGQGSTRRARACAVHGVRGASAPKAAKLPASLLPCARCCSHRVRSLLLTMQLSSSTLATPSSLSRTSPACRSTAASSWSSSASVTPERSSARLKAESPSSSSRFSRRCVRTSAVRSALSYQRSLRALSRGSLSNGTQRGSSHRWCVRGAEAHGGGGVCACRPAPTVAPQVLFLGAWPRCCCASATCCPCSCTVLLGLRAGA